jgi:hypothetical protein
MTVAELYRCARSLEAVENYALASSGTTNEILEDDAEQERWDFVPDDEHFWRKMLVNPSDVWNRRFDFYGVALSTWVARVPGLFWSEGARALRRINDDAVEEYKSRDWIVLKPHGKSQQVLGGIGTLKLPPDENGRRLVTLSGGYNASSGIPALISPEVWEHHRLADGSILNLWAKWQPMSAEWAARFPSIRGIPRGYLVVSDPDQVRRALNENAPIQFHPCTVMEYYQGDAKLYDFVFATADTRVRNYRKRVEDFFADYKDARGRFGKYLISADIADPLWEAEFDTPEALRRTELGAKSQLELLQARVRGDSFKGRNLELILQVLAREYDNDGLRRVSEMVGIPSAHWFTGAAAADSCTQLLHVCLERGKVEELLDAVAVEHPGAFV